ncbi:MAG: cysteine synthase A [Acholeplasmatales bacterium]|nr:cysteine synthase A [Acholeplasmatales bacterium]
MSKIYKSVEELIGNTPLLEPTRIEERYNLGAKILVKIEALNPAGSVKDRVARQMIKDAMEQGKIDKDTTLIEPTSGNTGIGIAAIAAMYGLKAIIVMPDSMSVERRNLMKAYGANVVLTPGSQGMKGAISKANELNKEINNSLILGQFDNVSNPKAHYLTTGPEIWKDTDGNIDIFIAGIGTGGTISGVGKYLKEQNSQIKAIGVEPASSPFITKGIAGPHKIQGIGAGFIPSILDTDICDEVLRVENDDAMSVAREIARYEGMLVGISSGAALSAAIEVAKRPENKGKTIVVLLPDSGDRYLTNELFNQAE